MMKINPGLVDDVMLLLIAGVCVVVAFPLVSLWLAAPLLIGWLLAVSWVAGRYLPGPRLYWLRYQIYLLIYCGRVLVFAGHVLQAAGRVLSRAIDVPIRLTNGLLRRLDCLLPEYEALNDVTTSNNEGAERD